MADFSYISNNGIAAYYDKHMHEIVISKVINRYKLVKGGPGGGVYDIIKKIYPNSENTKFLIDSISEEKDERGFTKYGSYDILHNTGLLTHLTTNCYTPYNINYSYNNYINFDYIQGRYCPSNSEDPEKLIPDLYKYDKESNSYKLYYSEKVNTSHIQEAYPSEIAQLFLDGVFPEPVKNNPIGPVKIHDTHYFLATVWFRKQKILCFLIKDITNNGPMKIKALPPQISSQRLIRVDGDICFFSMSDHSRNVDFWYIELAIVYNTTLFSTTDKSTWPESVDVPELKILHE